MGSNNFFINRFMRKYNTSDGRIYLSYFRYIFEPRYKRKLFQKEVKNIAESA